MLFGDDGGRKEREREMRAAGRLPPGQSLTLKWPVLHAGMVPKFDPRTWDFRVFGLVDEPLRFSWEEFTQLPQTDVLADFHCVTRWSRFDNRWQGALARDVIERAKPRPSAHFALVHGEHGFTANLPLADLLWPTSLFAFKHDGEPLTPE